MDHDEENSMEFKVNIEEIDEDAFMAIGKMKKMIV